MSEQKSRKRWQDSTPEDWDAAHAALRYRGIESSCPTCGHDVDHAELCPEGCPLCEAAAPQPLDVERPCGCTCCSGHLFPETWRCSGNCGCVARLSRKEPSDAIKVWRAVRSEDGATLWADDRAVLDPEEPYSEGPEMVEVERAWFEALPEDPGPC